jgi:hypothetical protein
VPPGFDWPTHGGYLGCLLGLVVACLLCGLVGAPLAQLSNFRVLSTPAALGLTLVAALVLVIGVSRLGWTLGRRFYREYPQPRRPVWGEDDDEERGTEAVVPPAPGGTAAGPRVEAVASETTAQGPAGGSPAEDADRPQQDAAHGERHDAVAPADG